MTGRWVGLACGLLAGLQAATQTFAWAHHWHQALGPGFATPAGWTVHPPWRFLSWIGHSAQANRVEALGLAFVLVGAALGAAAGGSVGGAGRRVRGWGGLREAAEAGLRAGSGCVIGELSGRLLATADLRPSLVTGGTRSGKGRGHVVPTLLSWGGSVLVHDPKAELWMLTAGWRATFSHALAFDPRSLNSARWNPLSEIRPGVGELAQVQRLVAVLSDPGGTRDDEAIWDKAASEILEAVILHVLYAARDEDKTLVGVRALLADLDAASDVMVKTLHRIGPDGRRETHPFIRTAVTGYAAMHDRFRTSVQGTARSYLKWLAGDDVERALSGSDFRLGDLMSAEAPVSLYVQVAPADAAALRPLVRLLFQAAAQSLTAHPEQDADGRPKRHRLLMMMDEFPLLGRLAFFEKALRLMSGYGIKAMFVAQSLNDIVETYGPHTTILDNCAVYTAFSALDPLTQEKVSRLTGVVEEARQSRSGPAGWGWGRSTVSTTKVERPLLEPGEVRALGDELQIVFAAGRRPLLCRKLRYDQRRPFNRRAAMAAPDRTGRADAPPATPHPWAGRRALGEDPTATLPLFKEISAAMDDRKAAVARVAEAYDEASRDIAGRQAVLDHLQGRRP